jgi:hypothetical protein
MGFTKVGSKEAFKTVPPRFGSPTSLQSTDHTKPQASATMKISIRGVDPIYMYINPMVYIAGKYCRI